MKPTRFVPKLHGAVIRVPVWTNTRSRNFYFWVEWDAEEISAGQGEVQPHFSLLWAGFLNWAHYRLILWHHVWNVATQILCTLVHLAHRNTSLFFIYRFFCDRKKARKTRKSQYLLLWWLTARQSAHATSHQWLCKSAAMFLTESALRVRLRGIALVHHTFKPRIYSETN